MSTATAELNLVKRTDLFKVPTSKLKIYNNLRKDLGDIEELKKSVGEYGVLQAVRGFKDNDGYYVVTEGKRRTTAAKMLLDEGIDILVPFMLEPKGVTDEQRLFNGLVMNTGKPFTTLEIAEGIRQAIAYGYNETEIAKKLSKSKGYISKLNSLNTAPKALIKLIEDGTIKGTLAIDLIAQGEEAINKVLNKATENVVPEVESVEQNTSTDGNKIVDDVKTGGEKKITKRDLQQNSLAIFKKITKEFNIDEILMSHDQSLIYEFVWKLINNKLSEEDIKDFFL
jgi:ParB/RepB/Spo0J family partition protein